LTDYWPQEEGVISTEPKVGFFVAGDTSVVAYKGVRCYTSDTAGQITVMLATTRQGWGVALKTVGTAGDPVPVLLRGIVKIIAAGTIVRDLAVTFDAAGEVTPLADQAVNEAGSSTYTIYYSAKVGRALHSGSDNDEAVVLFNP